MKKPCDRIKELRTQQNYTQRQVADYLKISQSLYAKYETGNRNIKLTHLIKLCDLYGCDEEYLLYGEGKPDSRKMFSNKKMDLETLTRMNKICKNLMEMAQIYDTFRDSN